MREGQSCKNNNILNFLSHPSTGCNRKILLCLYKSLIRPILDYGFPIYGLAPKSSLSFLDPVKTASLRIATGPFCTSLALSLCAETGINSLHFRRLKLTANLLTKISLPRNFSATRDCSNNSQNNHSSICAFILTTIPHTFLNLTVSHR